MGRNFVKRNRLESLPNIPDAALYSLGTTDINFEIFDEQVIFDLVNKNLDEAQARMNSQ